MAYNKISNNPQELKMAKDKGKKEVKKPKKPKLPKEIKLPERE